MKSALTILSVIIGLSVYSQSYTVIHSIGKIYDEASGTYLSKGTKLDESAQLSFQTKGARAAVLSSSRGRFIIQQNAQTQSQSDLAYTLSSVISPVRGRLSTRAGGINNALDAKKHFEQPIAILGGRYELVMSEVAYPMNESNFFYIQYSYNDERINKKLSAEGDRLIIDVGSLYSVDDQSIDPLKTSEAQLYYFQGANQESTKITDVAFGVVSPGEFQSLAESFKGDENQAKAIAELINDLYGKCTEESVQKLLNTDN